MSFSSGYNTAYQSRDMNTSAANHTMGSGESEHPALERFYSDFRIPLGAISLVIALAGIVFNIMNITVLLHAKMRNPVNLLLTMAAVSQMLLLVIYIPYVSIYNLATPKDAIRFFSPNIHDTRYLLFYADVSVFLHLNSSWLIITTACFRFIFVQFPLKSAKFCTYSRAAIAGVCTTVMCLLIQIPNFIVNSIRTIPCDQNYFGEICKEHKTLTTVAAASSKDKLNQVNIGIQAAFGRFIPTVLLLIFTIFLMRVLREAYKRKKRLQSENRSKMASEGHKNEHSQTTRMLLAVVILFFIVEFPHGILLAYVTIIDSHEIYGYLGEVIDLVTIIAFSLNLLLYSTMSKQYRNLFFDIFCHKLQKTFSAFRPRRRLPKYSGSPYYTAHSNSHIPSGQETCNLSMTLESHVMQPTEPHEEDSLMNHDKTEVVQQET